MENKNPKNAEELEIDLEHEFMVGGKKRGDGEDDFDMNLENEFAE